MSTDERVADVRSEDDRLIVDLADGRMIAVPIVCKVVTGTYLSPTSRRAA
jgi:hypothetical protein